jgi:GNAT superfamily N-acetyltransferase
MWWRFAINNNLIFNDETTNSYSGQTNHLLTAKTSDGLLAGYIEYAVFDSTPSISMIKVPENMRRQGYGKALIHELQNRFPNTEISWGMTTDDGEALYNSLNMVEMPSKYHKSFNNYDKLLQEQARLQAIADEWYTQKGHTPEEREKFHKEMRRFNDIDNRLWIMNDSLYGKNPTQKIIQGNLITVYHATDTEPGLGQKSGYYPGTYAFIDINDVQKWGKQNIFQTQIDASKIYKLEAGSSDLLKQLAKEHGFGYHSGNGQAEVEYLKSQGYIGLQRGVEIILFDHHQWKKMD